MVSPRIKTFCVERESNSDSLELCAVRTPFCCLNNITFVAIYSNQSVDVHPGGLQKMLIASCCFHLIYLFWVFAIGWR